MDQSSPLITINPVDPNNGFVDKLKKFFTKFKSLPLKTKSLISLGVVATLLVAIPATVATLVTSRTSYFNRAATAEPPPPTPVCKAGVNSFNPGKPCTLLSGGNGLISAQYQCFDSDQWYTADLNRCATAEELLAVAQNFCANRFICPTPTPTSTPSAQVNWKTQWASFTANDFSIQIPDGTTYGKIFRANPSKPCNKETGEMICVHSNPPGLNSQGLHYMTLEVQWYEFNDIEMRMYIYLYSDGTRWWSNEIRVYNGQPYPNSQWVFYYGRFFDSPVGQPFTQADQFRLDAADPTTKGPVTLRFLNVAFSAFLNYFGNTPSPTPIACQLNNQTVTLEPRSQNGSPGQILTYNVSVKNNNSPACGTSIFYLSTRLPLPNWWVQFSTYQLALAGGAAGTAQMQVQAPPQTPIPVPVPTTITKAQVGGELTSYPTPIASRSPIPTPTAPPTGYPIAVYVKGPSYTALATAAYVLGASTPTPTPTPQPTILPTLTPKPTPPGRPIIRTAVLPAGRMRVKYSGNINGYDTNPKAALFMKIAGLPAGLSNTGCRTNGPAPNTLPSIVCTIQGTPRSWGLSLVRATLIDNFGKSASRNILLWISPF